MKYSATAVRQPMTIEFKLTPEEIERYRKMDEPWWVKLKQKLIRIINRLQRKD